MLRSILSFGCSSIARRSLTSTGNQLARQSREVFRQRLRARETEEIQRLRQFRQQQTNPSQRYPDAIPVRPVRDLWKCLAFTGAVTGISFTVATIAYYERHLRERVQWGVPNLQRLFDRPSPNELHLTTGQKVAAAIIALNVAVFALWKIPGLQPVMWRYFTNSFASKSACVPMLLSVFSHSSLLHLGCNMYVLFSFIPVAIDKLVTYEEFIAFYLTAGVVSSLASLAHKAAICSPIRALGASGAIIAALVYVCMKMPESKLSIIFVPNFTFSAETAVYSLILFDAIGLVGGFRIFDHAAHLGGALFGLAYVWYGEDLLDAIQPSICRLYDQIRSVPPPPPKAF